MDITKFAEVWYEELETMIREFPAFAKNVGIDYTGVVNKSIVEWIETWLAWNELASEEDIKSYYGNRDE